MVFGVRLENEIDYLCRELVGTADVDNRRDQWEDILN